MGVYLERIKRFSPNARLWLMQMLIVGLGYSISDVLIPLYLLKLGHAEEFIGRFHSIGSVARGLAALPAGIFMSNRPKRTALATATVLGALCGVVQVLNPTPSALLITAALSGVFGTFTIVCEGPFMMENSTPEERSHLFSMNFVAMFGILIVGNIAAGRMPGWISGWLGQTTDSFESFRWALMIGMFFRLIGMLPFVFIKEAKVRTKNRIEPRMLWLSPNRVAIYKMCSARMLYAMGAGFLLPFVPVLLKSRLGATTETVGLITALTNVAVTVGCLYSPVLERKFGIAKGIGFTMFLAAPLPLVSGFSKSLVLVALAIVGREALATSTGPLRQRLSMELVTEDERPIMASLEQISWQTPWALASWLGGMMIPRLGYGYVGIVAGAFFLMAGLFYSFLFERETRAYAETTGAQA